MARLSSAASHPTVLALASKVTDASDSERVADGTGLQVVGCIPLDSALADADRRGRAILDLSPGSPYVEAVRSVVSALSAKEDQ